MPKISLYLVLSLLIVVSIAGIGVGYYFVPLYAEGEGVVKEEAVGEASTSENATSSPDALARLPASPEHLDALIAHHEEMIKLTAELRAQANSPKALDGANELRVTLMRELDMFKSWREQLANAQ